MGDASDYGYIPAISSCLLAPPLGLFGQSQLDIKTRAWAAPLLAAAATMHATDRQAFTDIMLGVFAGITRHTEPNFRGAWLTVPTNLNLGEWAAIGTTE